MSGAPFRVVFVCTGNTCRSPLAEAIARREAQKRGWSHLNVASAGVAAGENSPASEGSVAAAREAGLDLSNHTSTPLTADLVHDADLILTMSVHHLFRVQELGGEEKATLLTAFAEGLEGEAISSAAGVPDPFGGDLAEYARTRDHLERLVTKALDRLEPVLSP